MRRFMNIVENAQEGVLPSVKALDALKPELAEVAQRVYDLWDEDEITYGNGGICHLIADELAHVVGAGTGADVYTVSDNFEVHVYCVGAFVEGVYQIDIPYRTYEVGGGYKWKKIPDVTFTPDDILVNRIDSDPSNIAMYVDSEDF